MKSSLKQIALGHCLVLSVFDSDCAFDCTSFSVFCMWKNFNRNIHHEHVPCGGYLSPITAIKNSIIGGEIS